MEKLECICNRATAKSSANNDAANHPSAIMMRVSSFYGHIYGFVNDEKQGADKL
jgi:hypothetical protein